MRKPMSVSLPLTSPRGLSAQPSGLLEGSPGNPRQPQVCMLHVNKGRCGPLTEGPRALTLPARLWSHSGWQCHYLLGACLFQQIPSLKSAVLL